MADAHREIVNSKVACTQKAGIHCKHCNPKQKSINTRERDRKRINSRARRKLKAEIYDVETGYYNDRSYYNKWLDSYREIEEMYSENEKFILSGKDADIFLEATKKENVKKLPLNELERMEQNYKLFIKALESKIQYYHGRLWETGKV